MAGPGGGGWSLPELAVVEPWVPPSLLEVSFQPDVARLLQGPGRQGWGGCWGLNCKIPTPPPKMMRMLRGVPFPPTPWGRPLGGGEGVD